MAASPTVKFKLTICLFLLLTLSTLLIPCHADAGRTVRVGIYETKPLAYSEKDSSAHGFFVDMLNHVAKKEIWNVQYVPGSWQEGLDRLKNDQIDMVLCIAYTEARDQYMDFPKEFLLLDWGLVYKAKGSHITSLLDLEGKNVSVLKGDVYATGFRELARQFTINVKLQEVDEPGDVFKAVESGKAEAGVNGNLYGILNESGWSLEHTPVLFTPVKLGYAVHEGRNGDLIAALDRHIAEMKADKTSMYHRELEQLLGKKNTRIPREAYWGVFGTVTALLFAIAWNIMLKRQVRTKTEHLEVEIAERKYATEQLEASKRRFNELVKNSSDSITILDKDGRQIYVSDVVEKMLGYTPAELINIPVIQEMIHPDDQENVQNAFLTIINQGEGGTQYRHKHKNGSWVYLEAWGTNQLENPDISGIIVNVRDITERKRTENLLMESRSLLDSIINGTTDAIYAKDLHGCYLLFNAAAERYVGKKAEDVLGKDDTFIFPESEAATVMAGDRKVVAGGAIKTYEEVLTDASGQTVIFLSTKGPLFDANNTPVGIFGIARDITEMKVREKALGDSETKYRMLVNNLSAGVVVHASDSSIIFANPMASTLLGLSYEQMRGKVAIDPDWCFVQENGTSMPFEEYPVNQVLLSGKALSGFALGIYRPDLSDPLWVVCTAYPIENSEGLLEQVVVVFSDITRLKKAEEDKLLFEQKIQQTQKLESLGVLSGGIAHDFNNILAIIMGYCSLTKMDYETAENNITEIEKAAERAAALCRQMLAYAGKAQLAKTPVTMRMVVDEMVTMLKSTLPQNTVIKTELSADIPSIHADASQLRQVVMNLIINASEAIGTNQGEILVSLTNTTLSAGQSEIDYQSKAIPPGNYICLNVTDNGCGMDEETRSRVFEPFYTTKFTGRGLGMSAVIGIINSHSGALQLFSQPGKGTTFKVYLPVSEGDTDEKTDHYLSPPSAPWQGSGTVLLVEDEEQIRFLAKSMLEMFGFTVLEAVNGKEALELYQENASDIRVVVTDMGMPLMDGYALFPALKQLNHTLPIIISSGFGDADVTSRIGRDNIAGIISKPYTTNQLGEVLKNVLEGTASPLA